MAVNVLVRLARASARPVNRAAARGTTPGRRKRGSDRGNAAKTKRRAEQRADLVPCPTCNAPVREKNLDRHIDRIHRGLARQQESIELPTQGVGAGIEEGRLPVLSDANPNAELERWIPEREDRLFGRILDPDELDQEERVEVTLAFERSDRFPARSRVARLTLLLERALPELGSEGLLTLQNESTGVSAGLLIDEPEGAPGGLELDLADELVGEVLGALVGGGEMTVYLARPDGAAERSWLRFELPAPTLRAEVT